MNKAVIITKPGGPEVLKYVNVDVGEPKKEEVLIKHTVIGLNRYDLEYRRGIRKISNFPAILGVEAVGVIEKLGGDNYDLKIGDRVGYCTNPQQGAYCERRVINQKYLIKIPNDISDELAAAVLFKGMTAHYLIHRVYNIKFGAFALVNGATGGLGQILCQWANHRGCKIIGTVSSSDKDKAAIALNNGCSYVVDYTNQNFSQQIKDITGGKGVNVVYDPIGFNASRVSFEALGMFGLYVSYGQITGAIPNITPSLLSARSLFFTSTSINHYKSARFELVLTALEIFEVIRKKYITVNINKRYGFDEIKKAHEDMENRLLNGSNIIIV